MILNIVFEHADMVRSNCSCAVMPILGGPADPGLSSMSGVVCQQIFNAHWNVEWFIPIVRSSCYFDHADQWRSCLCWSCMPMLVLNDQSVICGHCDLWWSWCFDMVLLMLNDHADMKLSCRTAGSVDLKIMQMSSDHADLSIDRMLIFLRSCQSLVIMIVLCYSSGDTMTMLIFGIVMRIFCETTDICCMLVLMILQICCNPADPLWPCRSMKAVEHAYFDIAQCTSTAKF